MTRKRFVKLMMAEGYDRNGANSLAQCIVAGGDTYKAEYAKHVEVQRMLLKCGTSVDGLAEAITAIADAARRWSNAIAEGFAAFSAAYTAAMEGTGM